MQIRLRSIVIGAALFLGITSVSIGAFYGTAASEHYGWLLRRWAVFSSLGSMLLLIAMFAAARWMKLVSIAFLFLTVWIGIDPAYRLIAFGWSAE
jgi:hypothetical protein